MPAVSGSGAGDGQAPLEITCLGMDGSEILVAKLPAESKVANLKSALAPKAKSGTKTRIMYDSRILDADEQPLSEVFDEGEAAMVQVVFDEVPEAKEDEEAEDVTPKPQEIFLLARQQNFGVASNLLEAYPQFWTERDEDGHCLLHWAALVGSSDFVRQGLRNGIPVDAQAGNLQTPLMWAVLRGHVQTARTLLSANASLQVRDSLGATPLMICIQHKMYSCVLLLMNREREGLLEIGDKNGCTAAHWAAYKGDITALRLLDYFQANLCSLDNSKMQPLHRATLAGQMGVIEFLVERRADPQARNAEGKSCIDIANGQEQHRDAQMSKLFKKLLKKQQKDSAGKVRDLEAGDPTSPSSSASGLGEDKERKETWSEMFMKDKAAQKIFPVFWLVCVSLAVFEYLIDCREVSWRVAPTFSLCFELGVPLSLFLFFSVALGDPGKVPARARGASGVEELMRAIDCDGPDTHVPDISRLCTTTWVLKGLRTKYCTQTGACVQEFDHYCIWLNCAIGKGNHRQFVCLALAEWFTQMSNLYCVWAISRELVQYTSFGSWLFGICTGYPLLALIALVHCLTGPWVFMLMLHQTRLIAMNLTTNEMLNAHRYEHFWVVKPITPTHAQKCYNNPFHKGSFFKNWMDFWWWRNRSVTVALQDNCACCNKH